MRSLLSCDRFFGPRVRISVSAKRKATSTRLFCVKRSPSLLEGTARAQKNARDSGRGFSLVSLPTQRSRASAKRREYCRNTASRVRSEREVTTCNILPLHSVVPTYNQRLLLCHDSPVPPLGWLARLRPLSRPNLDFIRLRAQRIRKDYRGFPEGRATSWQAKPRTGTATTATNTTPTATLGPRSRTSPARPVATPSVTPGTVRLGWALAGLQRGDERPWKFNPVTESWTEMASCPQLHTTLHLWPWMATSTWAQIKRFW